MRLGIGQNTSSELCNTYGFIFREMWFIIDWPYKQNTPSIVRITITFSGPSEQWPVWVNLRSVVPSWRNSSWPHLHPICLTKENTWQSQLESSKNESAVMLSMFHSEGEEHLTTLTSVSLSIAFLSISWIWYCGSQPGILWTTKRSMLLEQLLPSVVKFSQRMVLL